VNTLRAKLALLLVVAIVSVVGLLTGLMFYLFGPPGPRNAIEPVAEQVAMVVRLATQGQSAVPLAREPSAGLVHPDLTQRLRAAMAAHGVDLAVTVSRNGREAPLVASIPIETRGWLLMPLPDLPPQGPRWMGLFKWLALITFGATAIAMFAAHRMVQPLVLLESAVALVGPDGILPHLPERGPAEVRATAKALNSLSSRLRRAIESRMRLVAAAGHDMRTPITRMRLRAEFIHDEGERTLWLNDLDELERIADSAILLVREESGKVPPELICLDELVLSIAAELRDQKFDVTTTSVQPVTVRASRLALSRALRNLMINAATHGVRARVSVEDAGDSTARVMIKDEGPGIPLPLLGQVFEPFFRADPSRRQTIPGAGLGLTIAREIIRRAGGEIKIANRADCGLTQLIELPKGEQPQGSGNIAAPATG
jgi:signal transduction histidine kinase